MIVVTISRAASQSMSLPIEDYEHLELLTAEARRRARWGFFQWLFFVGMGIVGIMVHLVVREKVDWPVSGIEFMASALFWATLIIGFPAWRLRAQWLRQPHCPQCRHRLNTERLALATKTRACPQCQHVFPSRKPPEAQAIALDAARLPRVWLAHEKEVLPETTNAIEPLDDSNPYAPSRDVTVPQRSLQPRRNGVVAMLYLVWAATIWPVLTVFKSRQQLLRELPPPDKEDDPNWRVFSAAYVRSQRRTAWLILPFTVLAPLYWFVRYRLVDALDMLRHDQPVEGMLLIAAGVAIAFGGGVVALFGVWILGSLLFQRHFQRWLSGSPAPAKPQCDEKSGYYALRLRFTDVTRQDQLPTIRFRFRQKLSGELVLRVVNFTSAQALEKKVPYAKPNAWQTEELDVRWLVRQSDPDFFGDELHFTSDPEAELEVDDLQIVRQ